MPQYELQRQANGDRWAVGKQFYAQDDDEAEKKAAEWISFQRLYFGEARIRIIKTVFEGDLRQLNYPVEDDEEYCKLREMQLASEVKMHLIIEDAKKAE